jgi:hypothetical protein
MIVELNPKDILWRRYRKHADEYGPMVAKIFYFLVKLADPVSLIATYDPEEIKQTLGVSPQDIHCFELWLTQDNFISLLHNKVEFLI